MTDKKNSKKVLGFWMLTALVAGNMVGSGVFLLPTALASFGSISIVAWFFTAVGAIFLALVFSRLSHIVKKTGGPYAYCREGFGDFIGFLVAYNYWIALWIGNAAIVVALVGYLSVFFPVLATNQLYAFLLAVSLVWTLTIVNISGIKQAGMLQLITTILKFIPLILIATVGLFYIDPHNFSKFNVSGQSNFSAFTAAATMTLWTFIGLESATVPSGAVENPDVNIPKATIVGTLLAAVVYILCMIAIMGILPLDKLTHSTAPFADAAKQIFGQWGGWVIGAGAVISCLGALNGWVLLQGQVPMAAAQDNLFPKKFAKKSKNGTPVFALIVSSTLITILLTLTLHESLIKQFTFAILLATLATLIPYMLTTMAELMIFIRERKRLSKKMMLRSSIVAGVAFLYSFWAIVGAGKEIVFYGMLLFFSGVPVYVWMKWRASLNENIS